MRAKTIAEAVAVFLVILLAMSIAGGIETNDQPVVGNSRGAR